MHRGSGAGQRRVGVSFTWAGRKAYSARGSHCTQWHVCTHSHRTSHSPRVCQPTPLGCGPTKRRPTRTREQWGQRGSSGPCDQAQPRHRRAARGPRRCHTWGRAAPRRRRGRPGSGQRGWPRHVAHVDRLPVLAHTSVDAPPALPTRVGLVYDARMADHRPVDDKASEWLRSGSQCLYPQ